MDYFYVKPEVAGGWGDNTVFERSPTTGTVVHKLHYVFEDWFGDALLTSNACYIVTETAAADIAGHGLTGAGFDAAEVSTSQEFRVLRPDMTLPAFRWLKITGQPGVDDFGLENRVYLVVSQRGLDVLKAAGLNHARISPYAAEPAPNPSSWRGKIEFLHAGVAIASGLALLYAREYADSLLRQHGAPAWTSWLTALALFGLWAGGGNWLMGRLRRKRPPTPILDKAPRLRPTARRPTARKIGRCPE